MKFITVDLPDELSPRRMLTPRWKAPSYTTASFRSNTTRLTISVGLNCIIPVLQQSRSLLQSSWTCQPVIVGQHTQQSEKAALAGISVLDPCRKPKRHRSLNDLYQSPVQLGAIDKG